MNRRQLYLCLLIYNIVNKIRQTARSDICLFVFLQVIVTVLDDNDHQPVFSRSNYDFQVAENVDIGHLVGTVTASDKDKGINSKISFLIAAEDGSECNGLKQKELNGIEF